MTSEEHADRLLEWWGYDPKTLKHLYGGRMPPADEMRSNIIDAFDAEKERAAKAVELAVRVAHDMGKRES